jgi:hypothetical protein
LSVSVVLVILMNGRIVVLPIFTHAASFQVNVQLY